jgi:hypothetical protein
MRRKFCELLIRNYQDLFQEIPVAYGSTPQYPNTPIFQTQHSNIILFLKFMV